MRLTFDPAVHEYRLDGQRIPSVTEIIRAVGLAGTDYQFATAIHRMRGSAVHHACAILDQGGTPIITLPPKYAYNPEYVAVAHDIEHGYIPAFKRFKARTGYQGRVYECPLIHPLLRFGGTFDSMGEAGDKLVLLDLKSGMMPESIAVQLALYWVLITQGKPVDPDHPGWQWVQAVVQSGQAVERWGVRLEKSGTDSLYTELSKPERISLSDARFITLAKSVINVYNYRKDHGLIERSNTNG